MEGKIYAAISQCMEDIGAVGKNSKNTTQGFMFRGIDAVMNEINPALIKNKVFVAPTILEQKREERTNAKGTTLIYSIITVRYKFYTDDGSYIEATVIGEGMDTGDKATNKALSIAFKYACFQVFCIPTEEMKDPDAECHIIQPKKIEKKRAADLALTLQNAGVNTEKLLQMYKVDTVAELTEQQAQDIENKLAKSKEK